MSFFNDTNRKRVEKMQETLMLIRKSGNANSIDREQMWDMLQPIITDIGDAIGEDPQKPEPVEPETEAAKPVSKSTRTPLWASIKEMAETVPLKELLPVLLIVHKRVDEEGYKP